jgi:hypothetical protein
MESWPVTLPIIESKDSFVIRLWDGMDNLWLDCFGPDTKQACVKEWNKLTDNGTKMKCYADIDYYAIFPADTVMLVNYRR